MTRQRFQTSPARDTTKPVSQALKTTGRPSKFQPHFPELAFKLALLRATDAQIADVLEVHTDTISEWKRTKPAFSDAIARGRDKADAEIAHSLYQRALGYSHEAVKIFIDRHGDPVIVPYIEHYPPDTNAASLWLRNRHGARWRDKIEANVTGTLTLEALVNAALAPPAPEPPTIEHDPELQADDTDALKPQ